MSSDDNILPCPPHIRGDVTCGSRGGIHAITLFGITFLRGFIIARSRSKGRKFIVCCVVRLPLCSPMPSLPPPTLLRGEGVKFVSLSGRGVKSGHGSMHACDASRGD